VYVLMDKLRRRGATENQLGRHIEDPPAPPPGAPPQLQ